MSSDRVTVAEIFKPRGVRGELLARSQTDVPGRLADLKKIQARLASGRDIEVELAEAWEHKGDWVLKLAGVDSVEQADVFRGAELWVPPGDRGELPSGEFFESDLVGLRIVEGGKELGVVEDVQRYGGPPLLSFLHGGREVLIPFVPAICQVDLPAKAVFVTLPTGLLEL